MWKSSSKCHRLNVESDAANVVKAVNERQTIGKDGKVRGEIIRLLSQVSGGICNHVSREANHVTRQPAF
ncbi:hypothetical protein TIFTF001_007895 [Ficus carica]|uniref:Uncharacterized protein n=1 Tax=Ficus carica TaxID=3494 RepID=A0AA87ZS24_FICCA|nr:hypothetical protein TIFTF001_007895 [Ficus carica]